MVSRQKRGTIVKSMNKKKICLITNWYPTKENPYQGLFFREQALALSDYYDFAVVHYQVNRAWFFDGVRIDMVNQEQNITEYNTVIQYSCYKNYACRHLFHDDRYINGLQNQILSKFPGSSVDVFYSITGQTQAAITAQYAHYYNKPYVVGEHGPFPWVGTLISEDNKKAIEEANAFIAISNDKIRQILMQGIKLPKIHYVGNLVDEDKFLCVDSGNTVKTFVTVGANVFYKNYEMLVDTFDRLSELTDVPFKLLVVGYQANRGYSGDSEELVKKLKNSKFGKSIELIPQITHECMPAIYARADAFVMTSIQEGQPVSAIEAGCCGLPIFATRCGGVEDYVDESVGRIVDLLDSDGLANYLKAYLEEKDVFDSETIREKVVNRFGKEAFIKNMVNVFESV